MLLPTTFLEVLASTVDNKTNQQTNGIRSGMRETKLICKDDTVIFTEHSRVITDINKRVGKLSGHINIETSML